MPLELRGQLKELIINRSTISNKALYKEIRQESPFLNEGTPQNPLLKFFMQGEQNYNFVHLDENGRMRGIDLKTGKERWLMIDDSGQKRVVDPQEPGFVNSAGRLTLFDEASEECGAFLRGLQGK